MLGKTISSVYCALPVALSGASNLGSLLPTTVKSIADFCGWYSMTFGFLPFK